MANTPLSAGIAQAAGISNNQPGQAVSVHSDQERLGQLEDLLKQHGRIELRMDHTGEIEIRINGVATFGERRLRNALARHVHLEVARVTQALGANDITQQEMMKASYAQAQAISGGPIGAIKTP